MGRKNRRRGTREMDADLIAEIMRESATPSVRGRAAATTPSPAEAGAPSGREPLRGGKLTLSQPEGLEREPEQPKETAADRAYTHAVEVCDRIVEELDNELRRMDHVRSRQSG